MRKEDIKPLLDLQEIDEEIDRLERRLKNIERERKDFEEELSMLRRELEELRTKKEYLLSKRKELREEIEREEEMLARTEERMTMVKKDIEYKTLLREKSKHEDNILKKSYELDELEEELKELEDKIKEEEPKIEKRIKEIEEELNDLELEEKTAIRKLENLKKEKEIRASKVEEGILKFYEEAKKRFGNKVVVCIEEGVCEGCGIKVPDVLFSKLIKEDSVEICPSCGRYIYYRL